MTGHPTSEDAESDWERRRRLAAVFGDALPDVTTDEEEPGEATGQTSDRERWLKSQVPPHH